MSASNQNYSTSDPQPFGSFYSDQFASRTITFTPSGVLDPGSDSTGVCLTRKIGTQCFLTFNDFSIPVSPGIPTWRRYQSVGTLTPAFRPITDKYCSAVIIDLAGNFLNVILSISTSGILNINSENNALMTRGTRMVNCTVYYTLDI